MLQQRGRFEVSLHTKYLRKHLPIKNMKEFHTTSGLSIYDHQPQFFPQS